MATNGYRWVFFAGVYFTLSSDRHAPRAADTTKQENEAECSEVGVQIALFPRLKKHDIERSEAHVRRITDGVDADDAKLSFATYDKFFPAVFSAIAHKGSRNMEVSRSESRGRRSMSSAPNASLERTPLAMLAAAPHWPTCMPGSNPIFTPSSALLLACHKRKPSGGGAAQLDTR